MWNTASEVTTTPDKPFLAYIPSLDGWRCLAIALVLFNHGWAMLGFGFAKLGRALHYSAIGVHIERSGRDGVGVFFCISGFLITRLLIEEGANLRSFYIRRVFRILPAALTYLACVSVLGELGVLGIRWREVVASLFFYRNYYDHLGWFTAHFWSLSIEEQFYLFWPSIIAVAPRRFCRAFAVAGILGIVAWRQLNWPVKDFAGFHTDMWLDAILCGSVMALWWQKLKSVARKAPPILLPVLIATYIAADRWSEELAGSETLIQSILVCVLIASTVSNPTGLACRIAEWPFISRIGKMSYSIYLWQQLFLYPHGSPHWQLPVRLAGAIGVAWLSYTFVERPLIAVGRGLRPRPLLATASVVSAN